MAEATRRKIAPLIPHIRFPTMHGKDLSEEVLTSGLVPKEVLCEALAAKFRKQQPGAELPLRFRCRVGRLNVPIQLKVKDQQGNEVQFIMKRSSPLRKLMDAYCNRLGMRSSQVRFMVGAERIAPDDTAENLGLQDEALIDFLV